MADLVFNIRAAAASDVRNLSAHELHRAPDGNSAIDPHRSHLNRVLLGPRTQGEALEALFASGVQRPTAQAEAPYIQIVVGASAEFFRPDDPEAAGTFQADRVEQFQREAMDWLKATFGDDLLHVSTHLDETTPHMHVLVAPTYEKAARKPGRRKRGETVEEFEARKREAAERPTVRTVGRASNDLFSAPNSFQTLRQSLADHLAPLGINYGNDLHPTDPDPQTTRENLKKENQRLKAENQRLKAEAARTLSEAHQKAETAQRATRAAQEAQRAAESAAEAAEARLGPLRAAVAALDAHEAEERDRQAQLSQLQPADVEQAVQWLLAEPLQIKDPEASALELDRRRHIMDPNATPFANQQRRDMARLLLARRDLWPITIEQGENGPRARLAKIDVDGFRPTDNPEKSPVPACTTFTDFAQRMRHLFRRLGVTINFVAAQIRAERVTAAPPLPVPPAAAPAVSLPEPVKAAIRDLDEPRRDDQRGPSGP